MSSTSLFRRAAARPPLPPRLWHMLAPKSNSLPMNKLGALVLLSLLWACAPSVASPVGLPANASPASTANLLIAASMLPANAPATPSVPASLPAAATIPVTQADQAKPQPADAQLARGTVFLDSADVTAAPGYSDTALVALKGSLPTPCHALRVLAASPDAHARIVMDVYSVFDQNRMCAQVIVPFDLIIPLSGLSIDREYTVTVNGQDMLLFHWPLP